MKHVTLTIPITPATKSSSHNFRGSRICILVLPAAWTPSTIGFEIKRDSDGAWVPLTDTAGAAISLPSPDADDAVSVAYLFWFVRDFRLVAGTAQAAARAIEVLYRDD